jgi:hypothetical protein
MNFFFLTTMVTKELGRDRVCLVVQMTDITNTVVSFYIFGPFPLASSLRYSSA